MLNYTNNYMYMKNKEPEDACSNSNNPCKPSQTCCLNSNNDVRIWICAYMAVLYSVLFIYLINH